MDTRRGTVAAGHAGTQIRAGRELSLKSEDQIKSFIDVMVNAMAEQKLLK